ncbi:MAG: hypothetical protein EA403_16410 [Spirochaetaceae bacterium]|nr:MAG: hypothetical protein EA403_16410 [Spirochaetaceae bacterium]
MNSAHRPNILHIFVDQMRFDCIGALGNPYLRTPALDRLVQRGTAFTSAYSPCPVCIPARCSMIYGQYPHNTGCYENSTMPVDGRESLMDALSGAGYRTHGIGKCHFSPDSAALRGFQTRETQEELPNHRDHDDYLQFLASDGYRHVTDPHGVRGGMYYIPQVSPIAQQHHPTQWIGDRALEFVSASERRDQPWYLYAGFIHPHPPFSPPAPWHKLYGVDEVPVPFVPHQYEQLLTYVNRAQNRYKYRDQGTDLNLVRLIRAYYYACISFIDYQVGRLLDALEQAGTLDTTLVVFASDHGEYLGDFSCFGKRGMHDVSARVPLIASLPGVFPSNSRCEQPVSLVDLAPTLIAAAGGDPGATGSHRLDGLPLQQIAAGEGERDAVYAQLAYTRQMDGTNPDGFVPDTSISEDERAAGSLYMAVTRKFKYIYSASDRIEFLFDRRLDPLESRNRAHSPNFRHHTVKMRTLMMDHLRAGGETAGLDGDQWKEFPRREVPADPDYGLLIQDQPWADTRIPGYSR